MTRGEIILAAIVWLHASVLIIINMWMRQRREIARSCRCFDCGAACRGKLFDVRGEGTCSICGSTLYKGQWQDPAPPSAAALLGLLHLPVAAGVAFIIAVFLALAFSSFVYELIVHGAPTSGIAPRVIRMIGQLPSDLTQMVDLTFLLLIFAVGTRAYRSRLARYYDRSRRCRKCGHDLRGTPTTQGLGRCGECGTTFMRMEEPRTTDAAATPQESAAKSGQSPPYGDDLEPDDNH